MKKPRRPVLVRLAIVALAAFLLAIPLGYGFLEYTTRPKFCGTCHIMEPYVKSWEESSHRHVPCVDCHHEPGVLETSKGKFKALSQIAKYVTGTEGTKPWAEVSDSSCMRGGCHSTRLLAGTVKFELGRTSIPFDHTSHLLEMRRSKKLRCTSCHSQIVQGEHLTVTTSTCMLCHFKGAQEDPKLSECRTCHEPPTKPIEVGGFAFDHASYLDRGVDCASCHAGVTAGTGEVPKRRCGSCHAVQEHIERYGETEFLHRKHVTEHKVDCLECHTEMTHRLRPREAATRNDCAACHDSAHGAAQAFYRGEGGRGVRATPSAMYLARVACTGCHLQLPGAPKPAGAATPAREVACLSCHGPRYEGMMGRWQEAYGAATEAVEKEVAGALAAAGAAGPAGGEYRAALEDARHDVAIVKADGSRGVHNPWYARKLLETAHERANAAWTRLDPQHARSAFPLAPAFPTKLSCATICHLGIEKRAITLPGTRFDHTKHLLASGRDCDACHSATVSATASTAEHGKTLLAASDCASCHHGPAAPAGRTCQSCHPDEDRFLRGIAGGGEDTGTQTMAKVDCRECHGDATAKPVVEAVRPNCVRCHGQKYPTTLDEWMADAADWLAGARKRLPRAKKRAEAEAVLDEITRGGPAHNMLRFEELKEAFDDAAK